MNKQKLTLPISILLGCIILGGFFYMSQVSKQNSIEDQGARELREKADTDKAQQFEFRDCLASAERDYNNYLRLNGPDGNIDGRYTTSAYFIDIAEKNRKNDQDNCDRLYKTGN